MQNVYLQRQCKFFLRNNPIIKKSIAAILLVIFAFSATPKKFLHNAFANHKDSASAKSSDASHNKISTSTINCQCDDLVVEAPFISDGTVIEVFAPDYFIIKLSDLNDSFVSSLHFSIGLRGPPIVPCIQA